MVEELYQGHCSESCICSCERWAHYLTCSITDGFLLRWNQVVPHPNATLCSIDIFPRVYFVVHFLATCAQIIKYHEICVW